MRCAPRSTTPTRRAERVSTPIAVALLVLMVVVGRWGDDRLAAARWPLRHPRLGRQAWLALAATCYLAVPAGLLLLAHDVLEHALMWALHADEAELHVQYAGATSHGVVWNGAALLLAGLTVLTVAAILLEVATVARQRRELRAVAATDIRHVEWPATLRVVDGAAPAAWCCPDRRRGHGGARGAVYVTDPTLTALSRPGLSALIAHEVAHLRRRHHRSVLAADVAGRLASPCGLLRNLRTQVRLLVELEADDIAIARHGRPALMEALLAAGRPGGSERVAGVLGAAGAPVGPRVRRLVSDPHVGRDRLRWWQRHAAFVVVLALPALPVVAMLLPGALVAGSAH